MENHKLYLCTKTPEGDLYPFYELNGSFFSRKSEHVGGSSSYNLDMFIPNINPAKFEEKTRKLKNEESSVHEIDNVNEHDSDAKEITSTCLEKEPVLEEEADIGGKNNMDKNEERLWHTMELQDSIQEYLHKKKY
ncbi:hypothetical protein Yalta_099 [Yalta virus]|nr:hypothetical protein Yalta_099 [Yalta virus]